MATAPNPAAPGWEPWMKKGVIYGAIREGRYLKFTYSKKDSADWSVRIVWPKKVKAGRLSAEDVTPGKKPGFKYFIVNRITYAEALPKGWTPLEMAGASEAASAGQSVKKRGCLPWFVFAFLVVAVFLWVLWGRIL